jgi:hypothetical protein
LLEDEDTAFHLFQTALDGATKMDIHRLRAECMTGIGDIMLRRGEHIEASDMWGAAHPLFVRSSRMKDAASVKKRLEQLSQQDNPHSLRAISEGGVDESTECLFKSKDSDTAAVKTRLNS